MNGHAKATWIRVRHTLKLLAGMLFLSAAIWLAYWLLFEYQVRKVLGVIAIIMFLAFPSVIFVLKIPGEFLALRETWRAEGPKELEGVLGIFESETLCDGGGDVI